jgi:glycosyltransferase involved in cell wall biosynthesis
MWAEHDPDLLVASYNRNTILRDMEKIIINAEVLHVQRAMEQELIKVAEHRRKDGNKTIIDEDDDLLHLSPFSPHYKDFGVEEVTVKLSDGTIMKLWEDGKNINIKENQKKQDSLKGVLGAADLVTVTTPHLADVYRPYARKITVLPNCLDASVWQWKEVSGVSTRDETRVYWSGGASHFEDWAMINKPVKKILEANDKSKLVILGQKFSGTLKELDPKRVEFHGWVHYEAYPYKTIFMQPTFGIIPLVDTAFSRGKSTIKWVEMAALGIPCVTSYTPPYNMVYGEGNGIFIKDNDEDNWVLGMQKLIDDPILRGKMGYEARQHVLQHYDINTQWHKWRDAFKEIL